VFQSNRGDLAARTPALPDAGRQAATPQWLSSSELHAYSHPVSRRMNQFCISHLMERIGVNLPRLQTERAADQHL